MLHVCRMEPIAQQFRPIQTNVEIGVGPQTAVRFAIHRRRVRVPVLVMSIGRYSSAHPFSSRRCHRRHFVYECLRSKAY